ncbi:hypothetical protein I4200191B4_08570 [Pseudoflavonifractor gallinarum]
MGSWFPAACTSETTPLRLQVCARQRVRAADCISLSKMLAFLRGVSDVSDTPDPSVQQRGGAFAYH